MELETRRYLNEINRRFYAITAPEFDQTRGQAWQGWEKLVQHLDLPLKSVLDVGCGNGRFGLFMAGQQTNPLFYHGVDNSPQLLHFARQSLAEKSNLTVQLTEQDVMMDALPDEQFELVVLFGVIHHVAGYAGRQQFMRDLAARVCEGAYLAFAAWRFYEQERFRKRIVAWDEGIEVEKHDYLLDWRRGESALRYCHYVDDAEHDALITATGMSPIADFRADGASHDLNRYSLLRK